VLWEIGRSGSLEATSSATKKTAQSDLAGTTASPIELFCIMKDDADCMALSAADAADAMAHIDPILTLRSFDRAIVYSERDCVTLTEGYNLDPTLHTRALLGQHKLSAGEIAPGF
jgi:hypothetical protein